MTVVLFRVHLLCFFFTGQFCLLIMSYIPQTKPHIEAARKTYNKSFTHKGVISTIIGAFILGAGMAVGGAVSQIIGLISSWLVQLYFVMKSSCKCLIKIHHSMSSFYIIL